MTRDTQISHIDRDTMNRYQNLRDDTQKRMGQPELQNREFVAMLLDVYEHHLNND